MSSYWQDKEENEKNDEKNTIKNEQEFDVCVIGAGITGLSTAYYLSKEGLKVAILEKEEKIGQKVTGYTTAKITLQHNLIYNYLIESYGVEIAQKYLESNKQAIENIKKIIEQEKIECDLEEQENYVYTIENSEIEKIQKEVDAVNFLVSLENKEKLKYAEFVAGCELPFEIKGAIKIKNQAQFNPLKYIKGLECSIKKQGGQIFTNYGVKDLKKCNNGECFIICEEQKIRAKFVVIATQYPFLNFPGLYFSKMYQETSYVIVIETKQSLFNGMYINTKDPIFSFRTIKDGENRLLSIAGGNHKTGFNPESNGDFGYDLLKKEAKKLYPDCKILYKWNTRDCITLDKIPYIGAFSKFMPNVYVATGFNKWGMTTSNVAANIIKNKILENYSEFQDVYLSTRMHPIKNREEVKNMINQTAKSFVSNRIQIPTESLGVIKPDNGGILIINNEEVGIYKNAQGKVYAVKPKCTHLGCLLTWNNLDKTWDCPCHGSRFDYTGKNLYNPALKNLEKYDFEEDSGEKHKK